MDDPTALAGYVYGALIPNYGGYLCYIGVADWARRIGVGSRLFDQFFRQMSVDAGEHGAPLPFVIWESHRPKLDAPATEWDLWAARTKLFDRVGGQWVEGVDFLSPNFASEEENAPPVPLQLFVKPMSEPAGAFDADRLKQVSRGTTPRGVPERAGRRAARPDAPARLPAAAAARKTRRIGEGRGVNTKFEALVESTKFEVRNPKEARAGSFRISCFEFRIFHQ